MKLQKKLVSMIAAGLLVFGVAACGDDAGTTDVDAGTATEPVGEVTEPVTEMTEPAATETP